MASSRIMLLALLLGGCSLTGEAPPPSPVATVIAPAPRVYTCASQKAAADELARLPAGSVLPGYMGDYRLLRRESWAARGEPIPDCKT